MSLNFNPLETNLVNLVIVISLLVWFLRGFLGGILERRRAAILQDLQDAESRLKTATENLSQAQSELAAAQQKAEKIRADGQARAAGIRAEGENRTISAMAAVKAGADADAEADAARIKDSLRREAALAAIDNVLAQLPGRLDASAQAKLIDSTIKNLENA
ncbi:F0F1 ATP synthase subunit B [Synechococcus sp. TAK9802]|uniref:F0F1 ATP synthase subunit B n=1 Tax=Synechococcus sp. TAK9802 TaxID=1442558 RepID=UPI00164492CB|nr:F0F1 ATP synthase subunit B [Synechococcus sp. TAK9802]QNI62472.1 ATP synthase subunit B [Synechococcus sp. TAK9802]